MALHTPCGTKWPRLEKKLRDALMVAGYKVLNVVHSKKQYEVTHGMLSKMHLQSTFQS